MKRLFGLFFALAVFAGLVFYPAAAADSAVCGLKLCAAVIIPSLFPFFVVAGLLSGLGFAISIGKILSPISSGLFGVSPCGASAFLIGITGGYPMGAAFIADLERRGDISRGEAGRLLIFCNNSGPAFIIGAVGAGVFDSGGVGIFLYAIHILAAAAGGVLSRGKQGSPTGLPAHDAQAVSFASALTSSVKNAVGATMSVCGFILTFSVLLGVFDASGLLFSLAGSMSVSLGAELHLCRALIAGVFELGNAIGCMQGLAATPLNLAAAAFILGWGGLSVHFQTFAVIDEGSVKAARYIIGRLLIALFAALLAFIAAPVFF